MKPMRIQRGFSLVELMVAVAIVAILAAVAMPLYTDYVNNAQVGVLVGNINTMEPFQEDLQLRTGSYGAGTFSSSTNTIKATVGGTDFPLGWAPKDTSDGVSYVVSSIASGAGYRVTATTPDGVSVCRSFPGGADC